MIASLLVVAGVAAACGAIATRVLARRDRRHVRLLVEPYRADRGRAELLVAMFDVLHRLVARRWWQRAIHGQPSIGLELHIGSTVAADGASTPRAAFAVTCPVGFERVVEAALRAAYPNTAASRPLSGLSTATLRVVALTKRRSFIERIGVLEPGAVEEPPIDRLLTVMAAASPRAAMVQLALTPAPPWFERVARWLYERRERSESDTPSQVVRQELSGGLDLQHRALWFAEIRVAAVDRAACDRIGAELSTVAAENRLVVRGARPTARPLCGRSKRLERGSGDPLPSLRRGVYASPELASLWHFPSVGFATVPCVRRSIPVAPAPPGILRPAHGGLLRDEIGPVTIHPELRRQNTAVVGTVEQGKSSYLLATIREDLQRPHCAVIVLDPKGDAADAAVSLVPPGRTCHFLDIGQPTCGFNPLAVAAPADAIADFVVAALRQLFSEGDIRASSDRYLRNAIMAALAYESDATLWDVARLLAVGDEGRQYRDRVGRRLLERSEFGEIAAFFADELGAQLADARATTTAKLDAPANKLARLLNSLSVKRVLLNSSLVLDLDSILAQGEVLVVKGALGAVGAGNVAVLMQLLVGALDAALGRRQDRRHVSSGDTAADPDPREPTSVALKIDEAPLVINEGFSQTLALKRSAGLETVACWQADAQWPDELRERLDALFAHRVYFATASAQEARAAAGLMMAEYSDQLRPGAGNLSRLAAPDARLHLPRHWAIASWTTPDGRQQPFIARTLPFTVDRDRLAHHASAQAARGGRTLDRIAAPRRARVSAAPPQPDPAPQPPEPSLRERPPRTTTTPHSYAELLALDAVSRVRCQPPPANAGAARLDAVEVELLSWLVAARWALSTQIHRRLGEGCSLSTTQRRLKRLWDAGLLTRLKLHRSDGGAVPMLYAASERAQALVHARGGPPRPPTAGSAVPRLPAGAALPAAVRCDVRLTGWLMALEAVVGSRVRAVRSSGPLRISPPRDARDDRPLGPRDLSLPEGRLAHGFLVTRASGAGRQEAGAFAAVTPRAAADLCPDATAASRTRLLLELAIDPIPGPAIATIERYDHLIAGWWTAVSGHDGFRSASPPLVAFICADAAAARRHCRAADELLTACHAQPGTDPGDWSYPSRARIVFVAEVDMHAGRLMGLRVPALPPAVRGPEPDAVDGAIVEAPLLALAPDSGPSAARARWT